MVKSAAGLSNGQCPSLLGRGGPGGRVCPDSANLQTHWEELPGLAGKDTSQPQWTTNVQYGGDQPDGRHGRAGAGRAAFCGGRREW